MSEEGKSLSEIKTEVAAWAASDTRTSDGTCHRLGEMSQLCFTLLNTFQQLKRNDLRASHGYIACGTDDVHHLSTPLFRTELSSPLEKIDARNR